MNFRLVLLLWMLNYASAVDSNCDFNQRISAGDVRNISSPNYPSNYAPGVTCRWILDCPAGYNCRLDCPEIRIPQTTSCSSDRLLISRSGDPQLNGAEPYCGTRSLAGVLSTNQRISVGLVTVSNSTGGRFQCTVTTQTIVPGLVPNCRCGERRQNRIVGGQETGVNEFTMMAGLADRTSQIKCGAVIISASHVVTAAHCVFQKLAKDFDIVVGEHDVTTGGDSQATTAYVISKFDVHPSYSSSNYDYDVAVVTVARSIVFSAFVQPVCLPFNIFNNDFAGSKVTVVGWGTVVVGGPVSNVPRKVDLDVLSQSTCRARGAPVTDRQMCTFAAGKGACQDDSGGPVLWTNPNNGALYSIGIISNGTSCASNTPGINTRVTSVLKWIMLVTGTNRGFYC